MTKAKEAALEDLRKAAEAVFENLTKTPGGDAYEYTGPADDVETLEHAIDALIEIDANEGEKTKAAEQ